MQAPPMSCAAPQISGLLPLRQLLAPQWRAAHQAAAVVGRANSSSGAGPHHHHHHQQQQQQQQPHTALAVQPRWVATQAASSLAQPPSPVGAAAASAAGVALQPSPVLKPLFSSRAKIADACLPWLKVAKNRSNLERDFMLEELYEGDISSVQVATCRANAAKVVIKAFKRRHLEARVDLQNKVKQEWEVHASLHHPNIIQAYLGLEDGGGVRLFMEHAGDSDAYSYINAKARLSLREDDARQLVHDVLTALRYMHSQGIVHRDIKSENVFRTASGVWKLGDFGSALRIGDERLLAKQVLKLEGTFSFAAPEYISIWSSFSRQQLLAATTFKLDSWSVGALAYDVLCGRAPFAADEHVSREVEREAILHEEPQYPSGLSYDAVSFMMQALEKSPQKRPSVPQLLAHPWFDCIQAATSAMNGSSINGNDSDGGALHAASTSNGSSSGRRVGSKRSRGSSKHTGN